MNLPPDDEKQFEEHDLGKPRSFGDPKGSMAAMEKATRYHRLLKKLRYAIGEGKASRHIGGEEMFSHDYDGGVANVIPRNDGRTLHVDYLGPKDASPGQPEHLNTLGTGKVKSIFRSLREKYPNSKFLTGIRPNGKRVLRDISKLHRNNHSKLEGLKRYEMVAGDFIDALRRIRSEQQKGIRHTVETIAAKIGAKPASTVDALADSPHYSVPGVAQAIYSNTAPEAIHALAAWAGLTGNIPGMAVFHYRPSGPDLLHRFRMAGSGQELRAKLDRAGIQNRVLVPHRAGMDVLVPDKGGVLNDAVKNFTKQQKTELQTSRGHFRIMGSSDQAKAREMFRDTITKQEQGVA